MTVDRIKAVAQRALRNLGGDDGSALVIIMFPLLIVALVAANLTAAGRTELLVAHNADEALHRHLATDAVIARTLLGLIGGTRSDAVADGRILTENYDGMHVKVSVQSESAKINLNEIPNPALRNLLALSCLSEAEADTLAETLADYIDDDDVPRPHGLEKDGYTSVGLQLGPRNGRLETLGELRRIPAMTFEIFERIRPYVTVYASSGMPDLHLAADKTVRAVVGADVAARTNLQRSGQEPTKAGPFIGIVTLTAWTTKDGIDQRATMRTVHLTGNREQPILVLDQQHEVMGEPRLAETQRCP